MRDMRLIIAGGRDYIFKKKDFDKIAKIEGITEVVSGCARGADSCGEEWAIQNGISIKKFPADWDTHGLKAGHIRNGQMAEYAEAVVLLPGGKGTDNMFKQAKQKGLTIFDLRED